MVMENQSRWKIEVMPNQSIGVVLQYHGKTFEVQHLQLEERLYFRVVMEAWRNLDQWGVLLVQV